MGKSEIPRNDYQTRLERWEDHADIPIGVEGSHGPVMQLACEFWESRGRRDSEESHDEDEWSLFDIIRGSREIVFDVDEAGHPTLCFIMYCLANDDIALRVTPLLEANELEPDEILMHLAMARIFEVPVVPNTEEAAPMLAQYHRRMLNEGFKVDEGAKRYRLTERIDPDAEVSGLLKELTSVRPLAPAEVSLIRDRLEGELEALSHANKMISALDAAIDRLESCLLADHANESELQLCITDNPILLGLDYRLVKLKHKLGAEYEMDYALIRWSGHVDLLEIEASTRKPFTQKLDPSSYLVHAEQQVLDWLHWVERNHSYAREELPGLMRPMGYVVIGRDSHLTKDAQNRLAFRNRIYGGAITVLTYDSLLNRAKVIRSTLTTPVPE